MSKVKIIFHGSQQFIEKDADDIQAHNYDYTDLGNKYMYKHSDGEHVTLTTNQTGQISFLPGIPDYSQSPPVMSVRFIDFAFVDTAGKFFQLPNNFDFDITTDMEAINDFFLAQGGNPFFPNLDILNSAVPRFRVWIEPVATETTQETRNFINVNVQEARNVFTREEYVYNIRISQNQPGAGYYDVGQAQFIFDTGRTVPALTGLIFDRDVLIESNGTYVNASVTRNRKGVLPRLSQRMGDMFDTVLRGGALDDNVDGFSQDRTNFPRFSLSGLEARQSNAENNMRLASYGRNAHDTDGFLTGQDGQRGVIAKIAQVALEFHGDSYIQSTNPRRDAGAKFDPISNACYLPHQQGVTLSASSRDNAATIISGFGNASYEANNTNPILYLHNVPISPTFYLRLDDDFHEKYFINSISFEIERRLTGGLYIGETAPAVHQFFSAQNYSGLFDDHDGQGPFILRATPGDLFVYERIEFDDANPEGITNSLTDANADAHWQQGAAGGFCNFIGINTSLILPTLHYDVKRNVFKNASPNLAAGVFTSIYPDITFSNQDASNVTLPTYIYPDFTLKVNVWGYPKFVNREGVAAGVSNAAFLQHRRLGL